MEEEMETVYEPEGVYDFRETVFSRNNMAVPHMNLQQLQ